MSIAEAKEIIKDHYNGKDNVNVRKFLEAIDIASKELKPNHSIDDIYQWALK